MPPGVTRSWPRSLPRRWASGSSSWPRSITRGQTAGELTGDVSPEAAARFALMLGLGSMLVRTLDLPETDPADWTAFIRRVIGAFTEETNQ